MRLLICAGGTGGGVYPALSVLHALVDRGSAQDDWNEPLAPLASRSEHSVLWIGSIGGMEADLVKPTGVQYEEISAAGLHGVGIKSLPGNLLQLWRGYRQSKTILRRFCPDVLFFTGGFVAVPMALAGRKVPSLLYVPDIEPGLALKTLARFSQRIALTVQDSIGYFPKHAGLQVTGYPVRADLLSWKPEAARQALNLSAEVPVLLVFGGSKGARSINRALLASLPGLLHEMQIVHISGRLDWPEVEQARDRLTYSLQDKTLVNRYHAFPYLHAEMGAALAAADLVVSRAGASSLGEFPSFALPAILVPYPHAWRYQQVNAQYLAKRGAAVVIADQDLPDRLTTIVRELMRDKPKRERMRQAMHSMASPNAAFSIAQLLRNLVAGTGRERK